MAKYLPTLTSILLRYFLKNGPNPVSFRLFLFFSHDKYDTDVTKNDKSIDGLLGTGTQGGGRMVGAYESTEIWWDPYYYLHIVTVKRLLTRTSTCWPGRRSVP